ncbi:MAG: TetR/AcrR family transcriptional repressor of nem operon [Rhodoferax sp.]|jgi:TetR/AcrR family transcriptional repressor of nem operon
MVTDQFFAKTHLLDCGERLIASKGFVGVGLAEILATAGVPKGSFYHYFSSKERFGEVLLTRYLDQYLLNMDVLLRADGTPARQRLMRYWSGWLTAQCLIVKLSAEVADFSETMRLTLRTGTDRIVQRLAQCLEEARADGSVPPVLVAGTTALALYELWLGASLLARLRRDGSPFDSAISSTDVLLGPLVT